MELDEFLENLHFDIDKARPVDLEVDWEDAPLPYKLYQDLPAANLSSAVSLHLGPTRLHAQPSISMREITDLLWYGFGLTHMCHITFPPDNRGDPPGIIQTLRRYVPSGGGLYPSELYIYLKLDSLSAGIYHYDVAHHRLLLVREGNFDSYLERALGQQCTVSSDFGVLFVSTMFWKNFYKYHNFAYRLQGLDAGVLIGQLLEAAKQLGYSGRVYYQFLDGAMNHLLGLCESEESVYAVVPLRPHQAQAPVYDACGGDTSGSRVEDDTEYRPKGQNEALRTKSLCSELPVIKHSHFVKSNRVRDYPMLIEMNDASMMDSTACFFEGHGFRTEENDKTGQGKTGQGKTSDNFTDDTIRLPNVPPLDLDFAEACRQRFSPGLEFVPGPLPQNTLAVLLREAASCSFINDLEFDDRDIGLQVDVACCIHGVNGMPDGAYIYDVGRHALLSLNQGDHRLTLQQGMSMPTVNLFNVPLCVHIVGPRDFCKQTLGYRGYRILQMEIGIRLQHLLLSASAVGMAGHPLLGYDERVCDGIYNFGPTGKTCLIQVPIGFFQKTTRFEGPLHG